MILTRDQGIYAKTEQEAEQAKAAGYVKCQTQKVSATRLGRGAPCQFYLSPETQTALNSVGGYYTCPYCHHSHNFLYEEPLFWKPQDDWAAEQQYHDMEADWASHRRPTINGLSPDTVGQIGEDVVFQQGQIPGYGPIEWWHDGGASSASPLDGTTKDWGIEVKTVSYDATHHRFIPGGKRKRANGETYDEKVSKNNAAAQRGKLGILSVLVLLDFRRSVADVFVQEHPLDKGGIKAFRSVDKNSQHLVEEVSFKNPFMDPHDPSPLTSDGIGTPPPSTDSPGGFQDANDDIPF